MRPRVFFVAASLLAVLGLAVPQADATLVARYNFDDGTATDQSGNANTGTVGGNISFTADSPFAGGLAGSTPGGGGAAGIINVPTSPSLEGIQHEVTLSFWMKADYSLQLNWSRIFRHADENTTHLGWIVNRNGSNNDIVIRKDAGNQNLSMGSGTGVYSNTWRHVMYTLNNGVWVEYVDGMPAGSGNYNHGAGFQNTQPFLMFGRGTADDYVGLLDDVALWDDAKGASWPATIAAMADWFGTSLDDSGIGDVAMLTTLGATADAANNRWQYTDTFAAALDASPLQVGKHYVGVDGVRYIIFQGDGQEGWLGVVSVPEPGSMALLGLGVAALARRRRRQQAASR